MATVLHPKGNRITVLRDKKETKTEGGIEIPDNVTPTDHCIGTILEMGESVWARQFDLTKIELGALLNGTDVPPSMRPMKPGDRVLYSRFAGIDAVVGGQNVCILSNDPEHDEIIGVLEGEGE